MKSAHDQRQIDLMAKQLENYEGGRIGLGALISELEFLLSVVEAAPDLWKKAVDGEIENLEEVYADALDENVETLSVEAMRIIHASLDRLRLLLRDKSGLDHVG